MEEINTHRILVGKSEDGRIILEIYFKELGS